MVRALLLLAALLAGGCFQPDYPACHITCAGAGDCPDDHDCGDDGLCYPHGGEPCSAADANPLDAGADAEPAADASPDADPCVLQTLDIPAEADGIFIFNNSNNFGLLPGANVSVGLGSTGLFRFPVAALPAAAEVRALRLAFTYLALSTSCQTACGSCDGIDASGTLVLYYGRSDWDEASFDYFERAAGQGWGAPGASAALVDRSDPIAMATHTGDSSTTIAVDASALSDLPVWRQSDRVSFVLAPSNGAIFVISTRENPTEGCGAYPAPILSIDYCLP